MSKAQEKEKAMEYLREHNLEVVLNGFVNRVARERYANGLNVHLEYHLNSKNYELLSYRRPQDPILTLEHSLR